MKGATQRSRQAFRPGTVANHQSHVLLYIAFSLYFCITDFPASVRGLLCFAEFLLRTFTAVKSVTNAISSLRRFHLDLRLDHSAFNDVLISRWKRALPLTVRAISRSAAAMPLGVLEHLCALAEDCGKQGNTMAQFLSLCFHTLARASTLLTSSAGVYDRTRLPTLADVNTTVSGYRLLLKWGKTHQHTQQAFQVPLLARPGSIACPVRALNRLLAGAASVPSHAPLFTDLSGGRGGRFFNSLTLAQARDWLRMLLAASGRQPSAFSLHSLRRGGATLAFAGGATVSDLQALGGWRGTAVHLYHSSLDARDRAAVALSGPPASFPAFSPR